MHMNKNKELKIILAVLCLSFAVFLLVPMVQLIVKSFYGDNGFSVQSYVDVFSGRGFMQALGNSFAVAASSAVLTTCIAFFLAYTVNYTNVGRKYKSLKMRSVNRWVCSR